MRILMLAVNDPAGAAINLCAALNTHTEHCARLATLETRYTHAFTPDIHLPDAQQADLDELADAFRTADVLHFHMTADECTRFGPFLPLDYLPGKMLVHHHHGHPDFRGNPEKYQEKYRKLARRNLLVSTPDLLHLLPGACWQPNVVPVHDPAYLPAGWRAAHDEGARPAGPLRIGHSPTRKDLKNTDEFLAVTARLAADASLPASQMVLMDDIPHRDCLRLKRGCDIFFDHMQGYFGMSSLEALSQGVPTVAGLDDWNLRHIEEFSGLSSPWLRAADADELYACLQALLQDAPARLERGAVSRCFMETGWNDARVVARLDAFYRNLCG